MLFAQRIAGGEPLAVALDLNRQRTDFIATVHRLKQGFAFQQGANHPDGKAVAGADGIDDVFDFNGINRSLFAFKPGKTQSAWKARRLSFSTISASLFHSTGRRLGSKERVFPSAFITFAACSSSAYELSESAAATPLRCRWRALVK